VKRLAALLVAVAVLAGASGVSASPGHCDGIEQYGVGTCDALVIGVAPVCMVAPSDRWWQDGSAFMWQSTSPGDWLHGFGFARSEAQAWRRCDQALGRWISPLPSG